MKDTHFVLCASERRPSFCRVIYPLLTPARGTDEPKSSSHVSTCDQYAWGGRSSESPQEQNSGCEKIGPSRQSTFALKVNIRVKGQLSSMHSLIGEGVKERAAHLTSIQALWETRWKKRIRRLSSVPQLRQGPEYPARVSVDGIDGRVQKGCSAKV